MFLKSLKIVKNSFSKGTIWFKITLILSIFLILLVLLNPNKPEIGRAHV